MNLLRYFSSVSHGSSTHTRTTKAAPRLTWRLIKARSGSNLIRMNYADVMRALGPYHQSLIVLSRSDPVCWDPSMETGLEEAALSWAMRPWLHPGDPPGFRSADGDQSTALHRQRQYLLTDISVGAAASLNKQPGPVVKHNKEFMSVCPAKTKAADSCSAITHSHETFIPVVSLGGCILCC